MSEIYRTDRPRVDEMRLAEIEAWWQDCREAQDSLTEPACEAPTLLGRKVMEADAITNTFLQVAVPEMLQELGRRLREDEHDH